MMIFDDVGCGDALHFACAIFQNDECGFCEYPQMRNPSTNHDFLSGKLAKRVNESALDGHNSRYPFDSVLLAGTAFAAVPSSFQRMSALNLRWFRGACVSLYLRS